MSLEVENQEQLQKCKLVRNPKDVSNRKGRKQEFLGSLVSIWLNSSLLPLSIVPHCPFWPSVLLSRHSYYRLLLTFSRQHHLLFPFFSALNVHYFISVACEVLAKVQDFTHPTLNHIFSACSPPTAKIGVDGCRQCSIHIRQIPYFYSGSRFSSPATFYQQCIQNWILLSKV